MACEIVAVFALNSVFMAGPARFPTRATRVARFGVWLVVLPKIPILGSGFATGA
jgi:hypothetical protein